MGSKRAKGGSESAIVGLKTPNGSVISSPGLVWYLARSGCF